MKQTVVQRRKERRDYAEKKNKEILFGLVERSLLVRTVNKDKQSLRSPRLLCAFAVKKRGKNTEALINRDKLREQNSGIQTRTLVLRYMRSIDAKSGWKYMVGCE